MPRTLVWASISIVLVCAWLVEGHFLRRTFTDASKTFLSMRAEHLESLAGKTGVGFDIGAISYFTKGQICDVPGLVIGREAARWNVEQRAEYCMAQSPQFAYLDPSQAEGLARWGDLNSWLVCQEFPDSNVGTRRMHYLLLRPDQAGLCPKPPFPSLKEYLQQGGR